MSEMQETTEATDGQSRLTEVLATRRAAATHLEKIGGTLFKLSKPDDNYPDLAWCFNEGSGMWQISDYTNSEVYHGSQFEVRHNAGYAPSKGNATSTQAKCGRLK
jgi:hypothetical protein